MGLDVDYAESTFPPFDMVPAAWLEALAVEDGEDHALDREMTERAGWIDNKWEREAYHA